MAGSGRVPCAPEALRADGWPLSADSGEAADPSGRSGRMEAKVHFPDLTLEPLCDLRRSRGPSCKWTKATSRHESTRGLDIEGVAESRCAGRMVTHNDYNHRGHW